MRRWIAILWHASFLFIAGALYFFFVLPRWFELIGSWGSTLGLSMRILCGALIGLAALPVVFTLLRTRKPEFGTPQLALSLRFWSVVLHVLAGVVIIGTAVSELWLSLDAAGAYLFGIYGAAAAVALLGSLGFYLAFAAELPPPPPKPLKPKRQTRGRGRSAKAADDDEDTADEDAEGEPAASPGSVDLTKASKAAKAAKASKTPVSLEKTGSADEVDSSPPAKDVPMSTVTVDEATDYDDSPDTGHDENGSGNAGASDADEQRSKLRNRRPDGKSTSRLFGRSRRGIALDD